MKKNGDAYVLFVARFGSIAYLCVCTTLQVILPYLDSLVSSHGSAMAYMIRGWADGEILP